MRDVWERSGAAYGQTRLRTSHHITCALVERLSEERPAGVKDSSRPGNVSSGCTTSDFALISDDWIFFFLPPAPSTCTPSENQLTGLLDAQFRCPRLISGDLSAFYINTSVWKRDYFSLVLNQQLQIASITNTERVRVCLRSAGWRQAASCPQRSKGLVTWYLEWLHLFTLPSLCSSHTSPRTHPTYSR